MGNISQLRNEYKNRPYFKKVMQFINCTINFLLFCKVFLCKMPPPHPGESNCLWKPVRLQEIPSKLQARAQGLSEKSEQSLPAQRECW